MRDGRIGSALERTFIERTPALDPKHNIPLRPSLTLVRPESFDELMELFTKLSGHKPTPEEVAEARELHTQVVTEIESFRHERRCAGGNRWNTSRSRN
jgi:hypothetical protein